MPGAKRLNATLRSFFDDRAARLPARPSLQQLCEASCKETRLWPRPEIYQDLMQSLQQQLDLRPEHRLLEVGCAAGFLAVGLAPLCRQYVGVDLSRLAIRKARQLRIPNADFQVADGGGLPFAASQFDRVLSYDVFTNFPDLQMARQVTREMLRVATPQGKVLIGAVPDMACGEDYFRRAREVSEHLDASYGPRRDCNPRPASWLLRLKQRYLQCRGKIEPSIVNYLFRQEDFRDMATHFGVAAETLENHPLSPFRAHRFNVVFSKRKAAA